MAAVTRSRPERRASRRNLLSDFDALVERALVASEEGRDPNPFIDDAVRLARELAAPCSSEDPAHLTRAVTFFSSEKLQDHKDLVEARVRNGIERAIAHLDKLDVVKSERHASTVKYFVRSVACQCTRLAISRSGRGVW